MSYFVNFSNRYRKATHFFLCMVFILSAATVSSSHTVAAGYTWTRNGSCQSPYADGYSHLEWWGWVPFTTNGSTYVNIDNFNGTAYQQVAQQTDGPYGSDQYGSGAVTSSLQVYTNFAADNRWRTMDWWRSSFGYDGPAEFDYTCP